MKSKTAFWSLDGNDLKMSRAHVGFFFFSLGGVQQNPFRKRYSHPFTTGQYAQNWQLSIALDATQLLPHSCFFFLFVNDKNSGGFTPLYGQLVVARRRHWGTTSWKRSVLIATKKGVHQHFLKTYSAKISVYCVLPFLRASVFNCRGRKICAREIAQK